MFATLLRRPFRTLLQQSSGRPHKIHGNARGRNIIHITVWRNIFTRAPKFFRGFSPARRGESIARRRPPRGGGKDFTTALSNPPGKRTFLMATSPRPGAPVLSIKLPTFLLLFLPFLPPHVAAQADSVVLPDGPYLMYTEDGLVARWTWPEERRKGSATWEDATVSSTTLPRFAGFDPAYVDPDRAFHRESQISWENVAKVAALSDIHGQYDTARKLLVQHGVMDAEGDWTYGEGHLVIVGDIFDRGEQVNAALWMVYKLEHQAREAGGRVHFLLGNHETMILDGDIRYVNRRYLTTQGLLQVSYPDLYGSDTYLGRWLRTRPLTVRINGDVYVHGGISRELARQFPTLAEINDRYYAKLIDHNTALAVHTSPTTKLLEGSDGPLWYRGYFLDRDFTQKDVDRLRKKYEARRFIVGHTSFTAIKSYFKGGVIAVDSSIKFGSVGELLLIEGDELRRGLIDGTTAPLEAEVSR